jgi:hypothetical protein
MKWLLAVFVMSPLISLTASATPTCRFSKTLEEHNQIITKNGCQERYCYHTLICGTKAIPVICKAKDGVCAGYDANECYANRVSEAAEYETAAPAAH